MMQMSNCLDDPFSVVDACTCSHLFKASNLTSLLYPPKRVILAGLILSQCIWVVVMSRSTVNWSNKKINLKYLGSV